MGVPLFSDKFLLSQAQQLLKCPTALVCALDASDWDPIKRHGQLHPQLDAALRAQESAAVVYERALDPTGAEARAIVLGSLTTNLSQLARQCVSELDAQILARATRFDEHRANGVMTIRVFGLDLNNTSHPLRTRTPSAAEQQIGICLTRIGSDGQPANFLSEDDNDDEGDTFDRPLVVPRAPQPQARTLSHLNRGTQSNASSLRIDLPELGAMGQDQAMMSPSAGVFHSHTLDQPLEIPPPSSRRTSPAPVFGSVSLDAQLRNAIMLGAPPGGRNGSRRAAAEPTRLAPFRLRGLGEGWADAARSAASTQMPPAQSNPSRPRADEALVHVAQTSYRSQSPLPQEFDPNSDAPPPLEYALPQLNSALAREGDSERSELSAQEMGIVLSEMERARLGVLPPPEPIGGVSSRRVRPAGWASEQEEVASEEA